MDILSNKFTLKLVFMLFFIAVSCNSVEKKIYVNLNSTAPCVRLLNATHQIGCQSSLSGNVGVLHVLESEENLDWVLRSGPNPPYMVILEAHLFNRSVMMKLKSASSRVAGVAVVAPNSNPGEGFSPHITCPNENTGVYSESYDPSLAHCNVTLWNPLGNGLSYEEFNFPIFSLKDDNDTEVIRQCYFEHNRGVNGSAPRYPLCSMQLYSHMSAVTDTPTCMRRNNLNLGITPGEDVCDPLGDYNVWGSSRPLNVSQKGHVVGESVVIAAARVDSRSFFFDVAPGADSGVSGFVTLLAAAHALRNFTQETEPNRTILYAFFHGETFDYIGSSRMVYDMENKQFAVDLDNVHSVLEIGQVGLRTDSQLWLHSDPVSRRNESINTQVLKLIENVRSASAGLNVSVGVPQFSQPLPPSSFQRFLRAQPIPGLVIAEHQNSFSNKFYQSMYDNTEYLNLTYPANLSDEEQLVYITDLAKAVSEVATLVARTLFLQVGGTDTSLINADPQMVTQMLYSFLVQSDNSWLQQIMTSDFAKQLTNNPLNLYVGVAQQNSKLLSQSIQCLMANLTGSALNITQDNCQNQREREDDTKSKHIYRYLWVQGAAPPNSTERRGYCVRSTVRLAKALSPAFDLLQDYNSRNYSTWTESRWKSIKGRIFLVASHDLEMLTLGVGVAVLLTSLVLTYIISSKADVLFSSGREPANATY